MSCKTPLKRVKKIVVARHGNTFEPYETPRRVGARTDIPLAGEGIAQAIALGNYLKEHNLIPDRVFCSQLLRTRQTAEHAVAALGISREITARAFLNEIDYGPDENKTETQVLKRISKRDVERWDKEGVAPPGWLVDPQEIKEGWLKFLDEVLKDKDCACCFAVTSNGIARFLPLLLKPYQSRLKLSTGHLAILEYSGEWIVKTWNAKP